jgi:two-component system, NtrC family, response regulator AtoC
VTAVSAEPGYQLVVFARAAIRAFALPGSGEVTIGRDPASDVLIEDAGVSRQHAVLHVGETLELEDLGRANGTFIRQTAPAGPGNDTVNVKLLRLVGKKARLVVGDCLLFGTAYVVLRRAPRLEIPDLAPGVVVRDAAMQALHADAARVARANINVLLLGETGVGKEVLARAIHSHSRRAKGPFLGVNCAALAESLLENELFGSEKGAFTGALTRPGLFEAANGGTLFLDEVGELPLATQAKLLRVLEERVVTRLGATRPRAIDVRILSATNRDLAADSRQGRMRPDLYFRLNGVELLIPPLRSRAADIEALAGSFLLAACRDLERVPPLTLSAAALQVLALHDWPGNVRELRNAIERAAVMCTESTIAPEHLPPALVAAVQATQTRSPRAVSPSPPAVLERPPADKGPAGRSHVRELRLRRERDLWVLDGPSGAPFRLKHSKGLAYLNELLSRPGQELHVLNLVGLDQGAGDAGPVLAARAKAEYEQRLDTLREQISEAEEFNDVARADRAREEIEQLAAQLAGAVGLGGRDRRAASDAERARINVQRRLKDAIASIAEADAELGRYLAATVKTGTYCCYMPI